MFRVALQHDMHWSLPPTPLPLRIKYGHAWAVGQWGGRRVCQLMIFMACLSAILWPKTWWSFATAEQWRHNLETYGLNDLTFMFYIWQCSKAHPQKLVTFFEDSKTTSAFFFQICGEAGTRSLQVHNVQATLRACGHWHVSPMKVKGVKMCLPPQKNWNCGSEKGKLRSKSFHKVSPLFLSSFSFFTNCTLYCYWLNANQILATIVSPEHVHHCIEPSSRNSGSLLEQC